MKKDCIAYTRVSTDEQGKSGLGLDAQLAAIQSSSWAPLALFEDVASGADRDRQGLAQALMAAQAHGCPLVVAKFDRLTRDTQHLLELLAGDVKIVSLDDGTFAYDEDARFHATLKGAISELERAKIGRRIKEALARIPEDDPRHVSNRNRARALKGYAELHGAAEAFLRECPDASNRALGRHLGIDHRRAGRLRATL